MADFGVAGSAVGVISLGIQVCQGIVQYYGAWKDNRKDIASMLNSIENLAGTLAVLELVVNGKSRNSLGEGAKNVQSSIAACRTSVEELQGKLTKVEKFTGSNAMSKLHEQGRCLLYPFRESTLMKLREIVSDIRANLSLAVDTLHLENTVQSGEQLGNVSIQIKHITSNFSRLNKFIVSKHMDQESQAIIEWLSPLNFFATHNDTLRRRQDGTGEWLFDTPEFKAWLSGTDKILWCSGLPGAGKTILASAIIDKLEKQLPVSNVGLAFIYCNYKEHDVQTLANLMASLVQQLVRCSGGIPNKIRELYDYHKSRKTRPGDVEYSKILRSIVAQFSHIYIVVDALDECNEINQTRSRLIKELQESPANIHLLCTSRHLGDINKAFTRASRLEIHATDGDVERFLEARISQVPRLVEFCKKVESLKDVIIGKLVEKAKGMFLLAELYLESLKSKTNLKSLRKALAVLPGELDEIYETAIERIQKQPEDESKLAMRLLSWITHATRALQIVEIQHAMAVMDFESDESCLDEESLPDEALLISICGGITAIDQESGVIRLVHYTAQEYFERHREEIFPNAQISISQACIRYLSMDPFMAGPCTSDVDMEQRLGTYKLLDYTSKNWGNHTYADPVRVIEEALRLSNHGSLLSSAVQAMSLSTYRYSGWSQNFPRDVPGIVVAAEFGLVLLVDRLLGFGESIKGKGSDGRTALHRAASNGHEAVVRLLLDKGADIGDKYPDEETALRGAAWHGDEAAVWMLIEKSAATEPNRRSGGTALHGAASQGHMAIVQVLLERGADIEAKGSNGGTALHGAARNGHDIVVWLLLEKGANIEAQDSIGGTALHEAALQGHYTVVKLLLEKGADIEAQDYIGRTALHGAAWQGQEAVVRLLLEKKDEVEVNESSGGMALYWAAWQGDDAEVQLLLEEGADIDARGSSRRTALHGAAWKGHLVVVRLLLKKGADIEARGSSGGTSLYWAALKGHEAVVRLLLEKGADVEAPDSIGRTALYGAAFQGHKAIVRLLLEKGANVNAIGNGGGAALHGAALQGHEAIVRLLIEKGADIEAKGSSGGTALHEAAWKGHGAVVQLLLEKGANVNAPDSIGRTALHRAALNKHETVVRLLIEKSAS